MYEGTCAAATIINVHIQERYEKTDNSEIVPENENVNKINIHLISHRGHFFWNFARNTINRTRKKIVKLTK